jgi:hypothetical protein
MRRRVIGLLAVVAAASAAFALAVVAPASAVPASWTVQPGGGFTGSAGRTVLTNANTGAQLTCASSTATGTAKSGSGHAGAGLGSITGTTFTSCSGPLGITFTVQHVGVWSLNAVSYNATSGVTTGTITNVAANIRGSTCSASVTGFVDATYTNGTGILRVLPNNTLTVSNVVGCFGLMRNGDRVRFDGSYTVNPRQTITMQP